MHPAVFPHSVFMCFIWFSKYMVVTSAKSINSSIFVLITFCNSYNCMYLSLSSVVVVMVVVVAATVVVTAAVIAAVVVVAAAIIAAVVVVVVVVK